MRIRLKRPGGVATASTDGETATAPKGDFRPLSQRSFLKLAGASLGLGLAAQLARPATTARADNIGNPDTYLGGKLYSASTAAHQLYSQVQNTGTVDATLFYVKHPGQSGYSEAISIRNTGDVDCNNQSIYNLAQLVGGTHCTGTLYMSNQALNDVNAMWAVANQNMKIYGWPGVNLYSQGGTGTLSWYGTNGANPTMTVDSSGNIKANGVGIGTFTAGSVLFITSAQGNFAQDNTQFFWDDTNHRLGIGTNTPQAPLDVNGQNAANGTINVNGNEAVDTYGVAIHAYYS